MTKEIYNIYLNILKEELVPAMGCTEPISIAYAAALGKKTLCEIPKKVIIKASPNIIKNVKSVVVPNTGGLRGIAAAACAGIIAGNADKEFQVLSEVKEKDFFEIQKFYKEANIKVLQSEKPYIFHINIEMYGNKKKAQVEIAGTHTNVIKISLDDKNLILKEYKNEIADKTSRRTLNIEKIIDFADKVHISDVENIINRQIEYNTAIAKEGLSGNWGAQVGKTILSAYGDTTSNKAKAYAAAGSDARMNGCEMPVVINSGSGNQGMTASLPVIIYAKDMKVKKEALIRALVVSNLVTVHMKTDIGTLSAYCGATSAGCGAGAGICYLHGGKAHEISHTIVNAVAINSGMICDGAKASCAAKIASAVEAGLLGFEMQRKNTQFYSGEGIVTKGVENTIKNVGRVARLGMAETDKEIIKIMIDE